MWLQCAHELRSINPQAIEDIEDFILLKGFGSMSKTVIEAKIKETLNEDRKTEWELSAEYDLQSQAKETKGQA